MNIKKLAMVLSALMLTLLIMFVGFYSMAATEKYGGVKFVRAGATAPTSMSSFAYGTWARFLNSGIPEVKFNVLTGASKSNARGMEKGNIEWGTVGGSDYIDALKGGEHWGGEPPVKHVVYMRHEFSMGIGWFIRGDSKIKSIEEWKTTSWIGGRSSVHGNKLSQRPEEISGNA